MHKLFLYYIELLFNVLFNFPYMFLNCVFFQGFFAHSPPAAKSIIMMSCFLIKKAKGNGKKSSSHLIELWIFLSGKEGVSIAVRF